MYIVSNNRVTKFYLFIYSFKIYEFTLGHTAELLITQMSPINIPPSHLSFVILKIKKIFIQRICSYMSRWHGFGVSYHLCRPQMQGVTKNLLETSTIYLIER